MRRNSAAPRSSFVWDGEHGKASSRSYGGFNLFASLTELAPLLESYGGHELAAGFTIPRENIPKFRQELCRLAEHYYRDGTPQTTLQVDCAVEPELLTIPNIDALQVLEPCGNGCPKPVLMLTGLTLEHIQSVGNGRHLRLRLSRGRFVLNAIYFSVQQEGDSFREGDLVDVAFTPQVNEFRGNRSVQLNVVDVRPACRWNAARSCATTGPCAPAVSRWRGPSGCCRTEKFREPCGATLPPIRC